MVPGCGTVIVPCVAGRPEPSLARLFTVPTSSQRTCRPPPTALFHLHPPILLPAVPLPSTAPGTTARRTLWLLCSAPAGGRAGSPHPAVPAGWHHLLQDACTGRRSCCTPVARHRASRHGQGGRGTAGTAELHRARLRAANAESPAPTTPLGPGGCACAGTPNAVSWLLSKLHHRTAAGTVPSGAGMLQTSWSDSVPSRCRVCSLWKLYSGWRHSSSTEPGSAMPGHCTPVPGESQSLLTPLQGCLNTGNSEYLPGEGGQHVYLGKGKAGKMCTLLAIMPFAAE